MPFRDFGARRQAYKFPFQQPGGSYAAPEQSQKANCRFRILALATKLSIPKAMIPKP